MAAAAQPGDGAKRLLNYEDDSSSSFDDQRLNGEPDASICNTEMFSFNLNMMKVSTPTKPIGTTAEIPKQTCQQLFTEKTETKLSTILEETKSYG